MTMLRLAAVVSILGFGVPFLAAAQTPTLALNSVERTVDPDTGDTVRTVLLQILDGSRPAIALNVPLHLDISIDGSTGPFIRGDLYRIVNGSRELVSAIRGPFGTDVTFLEVGEYELDVYRFNPVVPPAEVMLPRPFFWRAIGALFGGIAHADVNVAPPPPGFTYVGRIHFTISPAVEECCSSVLFLPGLQASRLYRATVVGDGEDRLWEPDFGDEAPALILDGSEPDIYTKKGGVIDSAYGIVGIYDAFLDTLAGLEGAGDINDSEAVAYDWRLDYEELLTRGAERDGKIYWRGVAGATSTPYIIQQLRSLAASSQTGKVTIVAHSNGGLLAKALTNALGPEASVLLDKIIFVGVPQVGTPKAIAGLLHGTDQGLPLNSLPIFFSSADARAVGQTMPSVFSLLPSTRYLDTDVGSVITFSTSTLSEWSSRYGDIGTWPALRKFMTDSWRPDPGYGELNQPEIVNPPMMDGAYVVHRKLDDWVPPQGVEFYTIAGWGIPTLSSIEYIRVPTCLAARFGVCIAKGSKISMSPKHEGDGDGTVITTSAQWGPGTKYWFNLRSYNDENLDSKHHNIFGAEPLNQMLSLLLTESSQPLPPFISDASPLAAEDEARYVIEVHSPVSLSFTSEQTGESTGLQADGTILSDVEDVYFEQYGDVKWLSVPQGMGGDLIMQGTDEGSATLIIYESDGTNTQKVAQYGAIPVDTDISISVDIGPGGTSQARVSDGDTGRTIVADAPSAVTIEGLKADIRLARSLGWIISDSYMYSLIARIEPLTSARGITIGKMKLSFGKGGTATPLQRSAEIARVRTLLSELERGKLSGQIDSFGFEFLSSAASRFINSQ